MGSARIAAKNYFLNPLFNNNKMKKSIKRTIAAVFIVISAFTLYAATNSFYCHNCNQEKNQNWKHVCNTCGRTICDGCFGREKSQYNKPNSDKCPACKNGHYQRFVYSDSGWKRG